MLIAALLGTGIGLALSALPAHPFLLVSAVAYWGETASSTSPLMVAWLVLGATTAWLLTNPFAAALLHAPDDACAGIERQRMPAALCLSLGGLLGVVGVVTFAPGLREGARLVQQSLQPYVSWVLVGLVVLVILVEPALVVEGALPSLQRLRQTAAAIGVGVITFCLSGVLGLLLARRSPLPSDAAVFGLPVALIGLFTVPSLLGRAQRDESAPSPCEMPALSLRDALRGGAIGLALGALISLLPLAAGGVCGVLARRIVLTRAETVRAVAVGAARAGFYLVSLLVWIAPGATLAADSPLSALAEVVPAQGWQGYWFAVAAIAASGGLVSSLLLVLVTRCAPHIVRWQARKAAAASALLLLALALLTSGWQGGLVLLAATAIGSLPLVFNTSPASAQGIVLAPATLSAFGLETTIAEWLGLL